MREYLGLLQKVLEQGVERPDRTGVGTVGLFGEQLRFDLSKGYPLLTTKKVHFKSVVGELLWFLAGETNVKPLQAMGVSIWDEWADPVTGRLGPIYGHQWRSFNGWVDQIDQLITGLKLDPYGRRHIVTAWNPVDVPKAALPPCHILFQMYVSQGKLSCHLYQRSADLFLGVPFNIASYALLTSMVAKLCCLEVGDLVISFGDVHIYKNHLDQVRLQLSREPRPLPSISIAKRDSINSFQIGDFILRDYNPHPAIRAEVAV